MVVPYERHAAHATEPALSRIPSMFEWYHHSTSKQPVLLTMSLSCKPKRDIIATMVG
ncbi:Uncharacterised protein [Enterobacter ludwigii]|nr:Uncharacterised protein [Enterobacter ludwigii]